MTYLLVTYVADQNQFYIADINYFYTVARFEIDLSCL